MSGYALTYVAVVARETDAVERFLGQALGLPREDMAWADQTVPVFRVGEAGLAVMGADDVGLDGEGSPGIDHMALAVDRDPQEVATRHALAVTQSGPGLAGQPFAALDPRATFGIRTRFCAPVYSGSGTRPTASCVQRIDHLGIASDNLDGTVALFHGELGCALESTETDIEVRNVTESFVSDKYGAVYHARSPEILGGLRGAFVTVGQTELEIMQDYDPSLRPRDGLGESQGDTKGDQSAIARFVARRGPGIAHVAFETDDIDQVLCRLDGEGWRLIDDRGRPGGRGSRIGFVHPSNFGGGLLFHFVEPQRG